MANFALKAKTAIKRIAAITTTSVMLGASMFAGVAAADLADYPAPFVTNGKWVGLVVVGADAAPADVIGAADIAATLAQAATTTVAGSGATTTVGGKTFDVTLGRYLGTPSQGGFDPELQDDDIAGMQDTEITFQGSSYDISDEIVLRNATMPMGTRAGPTGGPQVMTSLTSSDDDYKDGVFIETEKKALGYYYQFDSAINISKASTSEPLAIKFLGKNLKITAVALGASTNAETQFTARVGEEVFLNVGDTVTIEGKKITLKNVGSASTNPVIVDVDGVVETVTGTETVNGIELSVSDTFFSDALAERSATLVVGKDAVETYNTGDKFVVPCGAAWHRVGCKKEDPDWIWDTANLTANAATVLTSGSGPILGILSNYIINDNSDNPITVGGKYDFPSGGFAVTFDKLTIPDDRYVTITVRFDGSADFSQAGVSFGGQTSEPSFAIEADKSETLKVTRGGVNKKVSQIWISANDSDFNLTDVFYKDPADNKVKLAATYNTTLSTTRGNASMEFAQVEYEDTKSTNVALQLTRGGSSDGGTGTYNPMNLTLDIVDDNGYITDQTDDITVWLGTDGTGEFDTLGATANTEEAEEVRWNSSARFGSTNVLLGSKDENHRNQYGIIIVDPKSNGASNRAKFRIPADVVRAKVSVVGPETTVTTSGGAVQVSSVAGVPIAKLDTEVTDRTAFHSILVGGPAVNRLTAAAMGKAYPSTGSDSGVPENAAMLRLVENAFGGTKTALVVAGWSASNTRDASTVLKDYMSYADRLKGKDVTVTSSAGVITVSAPSVA